MGEFDYAGWLERELASGALGETLSSEQQAAVRQAYGLPEQGIIEPAIPSEDATIALDSTAAKAPIPGNLPPQVVPANRPTTPPRNLPPQVRPGAVNLRELIQRPVEKDAPPKEPFSWDPAVLLLYLGAFLVVTSGLVYASYNWADLGAWRKLGLLMALTIAFAGGGWLLLGIERVREAARTFVAIGALLVPANAIAASTVLDEDAASPALIVLLGSLATALLYGVFSVRPGGTLYRYGAAIATTLAIGAIVPVLGPSPEWGAVAVLAAAAILPDLVDRSGERLAHLHCPFRLTMAFATVPATLIGIGAWDQNHWLPAITFATATVTLGRIAIRHQHDAPAIGGALTMAAIAPATLIAAGPDSPVPYAWCLALASVGFIVAGQVVPPWSPRPIPRTALHVEAVIGFAVSGLFGSIHEPWLATAVLALGAAGTTTIAILRGSRWWLLVASAFVAATWFAAPGWDRFDTWNALDALRYSIPLPVILAVLAIVVERWAARDDGHGGWDLPVWIAAGIAAAVTTIIPLTISSINASDTGLRWVAIASAMYAAGALVAAWRLREDVPTIGYALWASLAVVLAVVTLPVHGTWQALIILIAAAILAATTLPGVRPWLASTTGIPWLPGAIFGLVASTALLTMLAYAALYVSSSSVESFEVLPDTRWPWVAYLATFAALSGAAIWTGLQRGRRSAIDGSMAGIAWAGLGFATVSGLLLLRMVTTDHMAWSRAGIAVAIVLIAAATALRQRETGNSFVPVLLDATFTCAIVLGAVSIAANILLVANDPSAASDTTQAATYGLAGLAVLAIAWWRTSPWLGVAGLGLLAIATLYAALTRDNPDVAAPVGLVALSWVVMGTTIALQRTRRGEQLAPVLRLAGIGIGAVAIAAAATLDPDTGPGTSGWRTIIFTLVMAAALLATEGWLRQDRRWAIAASAVAMAALLMQVGDTEPSNIQEYTVPLALYLLALGWISRRNRALRDVLLALGSVALLAPPLLAAQRDGDATQLLIGGVEALMLFVAGVFLRLRVAIAASVAAITLIVLRFLVDAAIALPGWISLLAGGLLLLVIGTLLTIWKDEARNRLERLQAGWHDMG